MHHHLYLLRHAKAGWESANQRDYDRALTPRGVQAAQAMGFWCKEYLPQIDLVLCSPALRTRQTFDALQEAWPQVLRVEFADAIYMANYDALLTILNALPDQEQHVMLIGHNPGLEDLTLLLCDDGTPSALAALRVKYPTGALAQLETREHWANLQRHTAYLKRFIQPQDLSQD
jgi:phosphohistidine phosphatase